MQNNPTDQLAPRDAEAQGGEDADGSDEIKATDIVFDCPHCGHNLAIDYRGAGLQIACVECGNTVLVPIPDGMKIDDLDLSAGELLTQLFQTRRMLLKSEQRIGELEEALASIKARRTELEKSRITTLHRCAEMVSMCQTITKSQGETTNTLNRMLALIAEEQQR
jgi:ribosomal protein S27E